MKFLRTPDSRFESLPDFPYAPHYVDVPASPSEGGEALRMHYIDEGPEGADPVLMLHGEPSWSFLYRKVIRAVSVAGLRAVAPDLIGFGRSDKPADQADYTYERHVGWIRSFIETVDLKNITLVCQDWGGLIGLRLVAEMGDRFARVVAANTFLPTGDQRPPEAFFAWQSFSQAVPEFPAGVIVRTGCARPLAREILLAYDAPFPDESYKAGARRFPMLVPCTPDDPASAANRRAWEALSRFEKPFVTIFGDSDPITKGADRVLQAKIPGAAGRPHAILKQAGHFLQEDAGDELGAAVVAFIKHG
jgi:haloalkane dehalogenase